ncbi:TonB-dependent receptor [bacterium]|nr:TonB-dependent receptor [bacterium]
MVKSKIFVSFILSLVLGFAQELPTVEVKVEVEAEKEKPVKVETVSAEEGQRMVAIQNIADVLNRLPGTEGIYGCVMVSPRLTIRSSHFGSRQVLVEGMNVNPIISCVLDRVPWTAIESVDVFKAPLPPRFMGSLSGVVLITLKNGKDYPGASVSYALGTYNTQIYELSASGGDENRNYFIAFNRIVGNEWREKMKTDLSDFSFKIVNGGEDEKFTIAGAMLQGEQAGFKPTGPNLADRWEQWWPQSRRPALSLTYERRLKENSALRFRIAPVLFSSNLYYKQWDFQRKEVVPMVTFLRYKLLRSELNYNITTSSGNLSLGAWWQGDWRRATVPAEEPNLGPWNKQKMKRKGLFVESTTRLGERRSIMFSLGHEEASPGGTALVPFISYNVKPDELTTLRISLGRNKLFPFLEQLYGGGCFIGNPHLRPFVANSIGVDWERNLPNGRFTATLFYSKEKDLIGNDKDGRYINISKAIEQGLELSYEKRFGNISLWANYTYLDAWDCEHERPLIAAYRTSEPKNTLKAGLTLNGKRGFSYTVEIFYWGKRATDSEGLEWWYGAEGGPKQVLVPKSVPSATIFNLKISKQSEKGRSFSLSISNLFDKDWNEIIYYPQAGRWFLFEFSQRF